MPEYEEKITKDARHTFAKRCRIKAETLPLQQCEGHVRQGLPEELGEGHSGIMRLDDGLSCIETCYAPSKEFAIVSNMDSEQRMVMTLALQGTSRFVDTHGNELLFDKGHTSISCFGPICGERQYQADSPLKQLRFSMGRSWLEKYFDKSQIEQWFSGKSLRLLSYRPTTPLGMLAAGQLSNNNIAAELRQLSLHGQVMSILAAELNALFVETSQNLPRITEKDRQIAHAARDILLDEFQKPPSIAELAKRAGTNPYKLKQLFHHFFDSTPYGLLLEYRMNKAWQLLENTGCQVSIAADFVGYRHSSNFSAAFLKHFGVSPKDVAKKTVVMMPV